ncbi:MAG TPA: ABC transporter permease [Candidatus Lumbricidophila sp.]|nr:ABC transporter permease [Candidatus Lumbricidophila sp.]
MSDPTTHTPTPTAWSARASTAPDDLKPARLRFSGTVHVAANGLKARPMRVVLSALGIAIGIAAMIAVVGISTSGRAQLQASLDKLGTNLLTVSPGQDFSGKKQDLPDATRAMISRIGPVSSVSAIGSVDVNVYRSDKIPSQVTGGIGTLAADLNLLDTVDVDLVSGKWLNQATATYPTTVLGYKTAQQLGIDHAGQDMVINIGGINFVVVGILAPAPLAQQLDTSVLIGWDAAQKLADNTVKMSAVFLRANPDAVSAVQKVLAPSVNPGAPTQVTVSRPSEALQAQQDADRAFTGVLLGLGAVALLVGGVGVANTMIISVLERRAEIGLRRSLGATRGHIRSQFLVESSMLALVGGVAGVFLGVIATTVFALTQGWPVSIPIWATAGGLAATILVGVIAGFYPSSRAAKLSPTEALAAP